MIVWRNEHKQKVVHIGRIKNPIIDFNTTDVTKTKMFQQYAVYMISSRPVAGGVSLSVSQ